MITVPLYFTLFPFAFFLLGFVSFALVNVGHLFKTGTLNLTSFIFTIFFTTYSIFVVYAAWYLLQNVDWQTPLTLWSGTWFGSFTTLGQSSF